jgi:hypothetical protein
MANARVHLIDAPVRGECRRTGALAKQTRRLSLSDVLGGPVSSHLNKSARTMHPAEREWA